jgi:hypothetical protein
MKDDFLALQKQINVMSDSHIVLRDYFAQGALQGLLSGNTDLVDDVKLLAIWAYEIADAMIEERKRDN